MNQDESKKAFYRYFGVKQLPPQSLIYKKSWVLILFFAVLVIFLMTLGLKKMTQKKIGVNCVKSTMLRKYQNCK